MARYSEPLGVADLVGNLKLTGQFDALVEQLVCDRLTVLAAKRQRVAVTAEEIQERADQYRRSRGLHRAADTNRFLDSRGVSLDEFEAFITDGLYLEKMMQRVVSDEAVAAYFKRNAARFEAIEVSHIVLDGEGKAKEMLAALGDDPDSFAAMAAEHSIAETAGRGGRLGKVLRGTLGADIEPKVFNAPAGTLIGPFASADRSSFEIFRVEARCPATLDDGTAAEIRRRLREEWLAARAREHVIEAA